MRNGAGVYRRDAGEGFTTYDKGTLRTLSMYAGDLESPVHLYDFEGRIVPEGQQPFSLLGEALKVLEVCAGKFGANSPSDEYSTIIIGRKISAKVVKLEARIAIATRNGRAGASVRRENGIRVNAAVVDYDDDDDFVTIVRKVLEVFVRH